MCPFLVGLAMAYQPVRQRHPTKFDTMFDESILRDELYMTLAQGGEAIKFDGGHFFVLPADGVVTSPFGLRSDPILHSARFHSGLDIANLKMSAIRAAADGIVVFSGKGRAYGNMVIIDHGHGFTSYYAHLRRRIVRSGQQIRVGEIIGGMGDTGRATGSHLHFELRRNDLPIDPLEYLVAEDVYIARQ